LQNAIKASPYQDETSLMEAGLRLITADEYLDEVAKQEEGDYSKPISMWVRSKGIDFSDHKQNMKCLSERKATSGQWDSHCSDVTLTSSANVYSTPLPGGYSADSKTEAEATYPANIYASEYNKITGFTSSANSRNSQDQHGSPQIHNHFKNITATAERKNSSTELSLCSDLFGRERPPGLDDTPTRDRALGLPSLDGDSWAYSSAHSTGTNGGLMGCLNTDTDTNTAECKTLAVAGHLAMSSSMITNMSSPHQVPYSTDSEEMAGCF
jgi:hypothetical protein